MKDCEHHEILISTWQDGELDRDGQVEMLDHLVRCAGCRKFYLDARGLGGLIDALRTPKEAKSASPEIWRRIEESAGSEGARPGERSGTVVGGSWWSRTPLSAWAGAAAAIAAAVTIFIVLGPSREAGRLPAPSGDLGAPAAEIRLGGNPAGMDDRRFVELTKSVLGADRKYRVAFYEIMKQVVQDTESGRPSSDGLLPTREEGSAPESPETVHGPS